MKRIGYSILQLGMKDGLTSVDVAGVDGVVDDAVLVELVVQDLHLDLEELVLPACVQKSSGRTVFS